MTEETLIRKIRTDLSNSKVTIEVDMTDIESAIDDAMNLYLSYSNETSHVPVPNPVNPIDLRPLNVLTVIRVFESPASFFELPYQMDVLMYNPKSMEDLAIWQAQRSNISTLVDKNFKQVGSDLYVDNMVGALTLECIKRKKFNEVNDPYWQNWIQRYSVAKLKEIIGNARGKYNLNNAPYSLDADALKSQGIEAQTTLIADLNTAGGLFVIMR